MVVDKKKPHDPVEDLNFYLSIIQENFSKDNELDYFNVFVRILDFCSHVGVDIEWFKKHYLEKNLPLLHKDGKRQAIFWFVSALEQDGLSQLQSAAFISKWLKIGERRVLQIFQDERKILDEKYKDLKDDEMSQTLSNLVGLNSFLVFVLYNKERFPENNMVKRHFESVISKCLKKEKHHLDESLIAVCMNLLNVLKKEKLLFT